MTRDRQHSPDELWDTTLAAWVDSLSSDNTRTAYRADLQQFGRWCIERRAVPLHVTMRDVVAYQQAIAASGASVATARRRSSSLSSFFDFAVGQGVVGHNPVVGTVRPTGEQISPTAVLDADQLSDIVEHARALDPRAHALVTLLAYDGLRLNETLALDTDHLRDGADDGLVATVDRGGKPTELTLDQRSVEPVRVCAGDRPGGALFTNQRAERLSRFGADHLLKRLPAVDGAPLTANALRRAFVTSSHAAGMSLADISERAGVDDVRTAQRYLLAPPGSPPDDTNPTQRREH